MNTIAHCITASLLVLANTAALGAAPCGDAVDCHVSHGFYRMRIPTGWDHKTPLPTAVFFHGYNSSADEVMHDEGLGKMLSERGVLLIAPNGKGKQWGFPDAKPGPRDDLSFAREVLDDVEQRLPIDRERLWATGFSLGGSMTWYLACYMGNRFAAFAPVAGAYWEPMPVACPSGPVSMRHIHGTADKMVPMTGRTVGNGQFTQGDVLRSIAQLRARDGCPETPTTLQQRGTMTCRTWAASACSSKHEIELCLHPGEHEIEAGWIADDYAWVDGLAKARAKVLNSSSAAGETSRSH